MTREQPVLFEAGALRLEGVLSKPSGARRAAVVCHPHPQYGGTMDNAVVRAVTKHLSGAGVATLRFNFRGVGRSEGRHEQDFAESADARGAVGFLRTECGIDTIGIAGYSFGAMIACLAAETIPSVTRVAAVALPVRMFEVECLRRNAHSVLLVQGDRDPYCSTEAIRGLASSLGARAQVRHIPGADHFLAGFEDVVGAEVARFWIEEEASNGS